MSRSWSQTSPTRDQFSRLAVSTSPTNRSTDRATNHRTIAHVPQPLRDLLHPVVQSLSLLESAIHSRRRAHIQPSTACVITAVRDALLRTDCLNKSSPVLATHPALGKERKIILIELSKLVGLAKAASISYQNPEDAESEQEAQDMEILAQTARIVFTTMKKFILLASDYEVEPTPAPKEAPDTLPGGPANEAGTDDVLSSRAATVGPSRSRVPSSNARLQETFKSRAASFSDLRLAARRDEAVESAPPPVPQTAGAVHNNNSSGSQWTSSPISATFSISPFPSSASTHSSSPVSFQTNHRRTMDSVDSNASTDSLPQSLAESRRKSWRRSLSDVHSPAALGELSLTTEDEIMDAISQAEEALVSMVAALIGHIHSLHIDSHPSLRGILIEMTCTLVDRVRDVLVVVEAVGRDPQIRRLLPRETALLLATKENMYESSIRLVDSVESVGDSSLTSLGEEEYDKTKRSLLNISTATLRAGSDCVRAVKACVPPGLGLAAGIGAANSTPRHIETANKQLTPRPAGPEPTVVLRERTMGQRGEHTLSGLHRKASSLSVLHKRLQDNGFLAPSEEGSTSATDEDDTEEFVSDATRDEDVTVQPGQTLQPFPLGKVSRHVSKTCADLQQRPPLVFTHSSPLLGTPGPRSAELTRSYSDDHRPTPRSRSSSLSSPRPPSRSQHRSPSRSADLDKFANDYDIPLSTAHLSPFHTPRIDRTLGPSHDWSDVTTPRPREVNGGTAPQTPEPTQWAHAQGDATGLGIPGVQARPTLPRITTESADDDEPPQVISQPLIERRPSPPLPSVNTDVRFWAAAHDYDPKEIAFNSDGVIVGASLPVLVEKMTPHDGPVDPTFWSTFFITFRMWTTPTELTKAIIARYDLQPPSVVTFGEKEQAIWVERKVVPVRLRIYNFLKSWLDSHWHEDTDDVVLETLERFARDVMVHTLPAMAPRLLDTIRKRQAGPLSAVPSELSLKRMSGERFGSFGRGSISAMPSPFAPGTLPPTPIISKSLNSVLQRNPPPSSVSITDFDPTEVARQLTLIESNLFREVRPEDLLVNGKRSVPALKALSTLSNHITGWVADNVLNEHDAKKRANLLKFYIKLADVSLFALFVVW